MDIFSWQHINKVYLFTIVLVSLSLGYLSIQKGHDWGGDFALYIDQAQALKNGTLDKLYEQNKFTVEHSDIATLSPYLYPNGFPLLLTPFNTASPDYYWLKLYALVFFGFLILVIYLFFNQISKNKFLVLFITACIAFHFEFFLHLDQIYADIPFTLFSFLSFYLIHKQKKKGYLQYILIGLCIGLAYLIRTNGIFLIPTLLAYQLLNPNKERWVTKATPYIIFSLFFLTNQLTTVNYESNYLSMLSITNFSTIKSNLNYYLAIISKYPFGSFDDLSFSVSILQLLVVLPLCTYGFYKNWRKMLPFAVFVTLNLALYIIWPSKQGLRFLFPIMPIIIGLFALGIYHLPFKRLKYGFMVLCLGLVCYNSLNKLSEHRQISTNECLTKDTKELYTYIKQNTDKNAIFNFKKPRVLRHFTGRNAVVQKTYNLNVPQIWGYLITNTETDIENQELELVFRNNSFIAYKLKQYY